MSSLVVLSVLAFAGFFLTLSSLPLRAIAVGAPAAAAGLVTTAMLATTVATQTVVPLLVVRFGLVRVLAGGLILLGAPSPLYPLVHQFWWLLAVSAARGIGFAVVTVLLPLTASRMVPTARRGEAIGIYGLAIAIPNLLTVPGGVALTSAGHFDVVAVAAVSPLLALPLLGPIGRAIRPSAPDPDSGPVVTPAPLAAVAAVAASVVVLLGVTLSGGGVLTFLPVARPTGPLATVALLVFGATGALGRWRAGVLSDRWGARRLLPLTVGVAAAGLVLLALGLAGPSAALVIIGSAVLGLGYGSVQNVTLVVAFERAGPANQATASAVWNAAYDTGTAVGALLVGVVAAGGWGFGWTFAGCAALVALTTPLAVSATRPARPIGSG